MLSEDVSEHFSMLCSDSVPGQHRQLGRWWNVILLVLTRRSRDVGDLRVHVYHLEGSMASFLVSSRMSMKTGSKKLAFEA